MLYCRLMCSVIVLHVGWKVWSRFYPTKTSSSPECSLCLQQGFWQTVHQVISTKWVNLTYYKKKWQLCNGCLFPRFSPTNPFTIRLNETYWSPWGHGDNRIPIWLQATAAGLQRCRDLEILNRWRKLNQITRFFFCELENISKVNFF